MKKKSIISWDLKFKIIILNMSIYTMSTVFFINSNTREEIIIFTIIMFFITSIFIIMLTNMISKRLTFENYYLKEKGSGLNVLSNIEESTGLKIQKLEEEIFYIVYKQKRFLDSPIKEITFIIYNNRISLNIQNKQDSGLLYSIDVTEKKIRSILLEYSQKNKILE